MNATLKNWLDNTKDESAKKIIAHLAKRVDDDRGLAKDIEGKSWDDCYAYIRSQAQKRAVNGVACIEDNDVYEWAEDFCRMSNEEIAKSKAKTAPKTAPKTTKRNVTNATPKSKRGAKKPDPVDDDEDNIVSMFDNDDVDEDNDDNEQVSLFD